MPMNIEKQFFRWKLLIKLRGRALTIFLLLMLVATNVVVISDVIADEEDASSIVNTLLTAFPGAELIEQEHGRYPNYQLNLGSLRKVNGVWSAEHEIRISGDVSRFTYLIPMGFKASEVLAYYRAQLKKSVFNVLFRCNGKACGSGNRWANHVFHRRELFGPDQGQFYLVGELFHNKAQQYYVTLYVNQRGNKKVYAHLELVKPSQYNQQDSHDNRELMLSVWNNGLAFPLYLTQKEKQLDVTKHNQLLMDLVSVLAANPDLDFFIVGHRYGLSSLASAKQVSLEDANRLKAYLARHGIDEQRLKTVGLGPLAPGVGRNRIELVVNNGQ